MIKGLPPDQICSMRSLQFHDYHLFATYLGFRRERDLFTVGNDYIEIRYGI